MKNSTAYCKAWLDRIRGGELKEKQMLSAFNKAWKAAEYVLGRFSRDEAKDGNAKENVEVAEGDALDAAA